MARMDRCAVCDYSEANGSGIAGVNPGAHGRVRRYGTDTLCDACIAVTAQTLKGYEKDEE